MMETVRRMMIAPMPESTVSMSLKYDGESVRNGTLPVDDVVLALQGFAGAYGKVASSVLPDSSHEIRVSGFKTGSFDMTLVGWITSQEGQEALKALGELSTAAATVFGIIRTYIELKKHIRAKPYQVNIEGSNNTLLIVNSEGNAVETTRESLNLLQSRLIDPDLAKIVKPLNEGTVDDTTISAVGKEEQPTVITSVDKASFALQSALETFQDATIIGTLISNNRETRKGTFASGSGDRVPYHYTGPDPELFQSTYAFSGKVRVSGRAFFDENLKLRRIDITDAVKIQHELELTTGQPMSLLSHPTLKDYPGLMNLNPPLLRNDQDI